MEIDFMNAEESFLRTIDVHELLAQQEPFVMVGSLVRLDDITTMTETVFTEDNIFVEDGRFAAAGLIENIAQTCALRIGYISKYVYHLEPQIGYIGAIRNMDILELPEVGKTVTTTVVVKEQVFGMTLVDAIVSCDGKTIASAEMKIAVPNG